MRAFFFVAAVLVVASAGCSSGIPGQISIVAGSGKATIDGTLSAGEWSAAAVLRVPVNVSGGTTPGTLLLMNDATDLYLALTYDKSGKDLGNSLSIDFDVDSSNSLSPGDDGFVMNPSNGFTDFFRTLAPPCNGQALCGIPDIDVGGTNDGAAAYHNDGATTVYELRHPLKSGDPHDFSLDHGSHIGVILFLRYQTEAGILVDTEFPTGTPVPFFELTIR